jgi:undecaprenyl-diphosphatase
MFLLDIPIVRAIILGIIQGLTEFLPVSSSGHLVAVPYLLSWDSPEMAFNVALHAGTLVAVIGYFAADIWYLATRSVGIGIVAEGEAARARRAVALLAVGTVPAAAVGIALGGFLEPVFAEPYWVAGFWLLTAALLLSAELIRRARARRLVADGALPDAADRDLPGLEVGRDETTIGFRDVIAIGVAQAAALLPGVSRSGATIAAGMYVGLSRAAAARFSFLLAIPIIAGATLSEVPALFATDAQQVFTRGEVIAGMVAAALSGWWAIRYLLRLVQRDDLLGFVRYLVLAAGLLAVGRMWLGPPGVL